MGSTSEVVVPVERVARWIENFIARHGETALGVADGSLTGTAADGSTFVASVPFSRRYAGPPEVAPFVDACAPPEDWGILLVRKGGFAIARLHGTEMLDSKTGQRHVQGRTKAGGQSQQRFARRRENQAAAAYAAAADHAARLVATAPVLVVGGDAAAVEAVLADPRLRRTEVVGEFLTVPDPRRSVLEQAVLDGCSARMSVVNA